jgi:DNA-directed RNA polymerase specialized sigma24 family protein
VGDEAVDHALALLGAERKRALRDAIRTHKALRKARREYEEAMLNANRVGVPHSEIARAIGMSETGVRLFIKRRKDKRDRAE